MNKENGLERGTTSLVKSKFLNYDKKMWGEKGVLSMFVKVSVGQKFLVGLSK